MTMYGVHNGTDPANRDKIRRLRVDDIAAIVARSSPGASKAAATAMPSRGHSGRVFVLVAGVIVLATWATLYLVFREWRTKYRERAQYGATEVVPVIEPLLGVMPPGVDVAQWRDAVEPNARHVVDRHRIQLARCPRHGRPQGRAHTARQAGLSLARAGP